MQTKIPFLLKMFHYVIDQLRKFALPHKTNQSFTKIDPSFTVQDRLERGGPPVGAQSQALLVLVSAQVRSRLTKVRNRHSLGKVNGLDDRQVVEPKACTPVCSKPGGSLERDCIGNKHQALRARSGRRALVGHGRVRKINETTQRLGRVRLRIGGIVDGRPRW